jgi:hypothetical protein
MTPIAQGRYTMIMGFKTAPFAVTQLIGMRGNHRTIADLTDLTRTSSYGF